MHVTHHQSHSKNWPMPPFNQIMCPGAKHIPKQINIRDIDSLEDKENTQKTCAH